MIAKNIVLFDMDNTLVTVDTSDLWGYFLKNKGIVTLADHKMRIKLQNDYKAQCLDIHENYSFEISLINKIPVGKRVSWQQEFIETLVMPKISKLGLELIEEYRQLQNTTVLLITATLDFIAEPVAQFTKLHGFIATTAEVENGNYTGKIVDVACLREGKVQRFKTWLQQQNITPLSTTCYSDSINDLPLLNYVDNPIAVDPDNALKRIAKAKQWRIISFKN